MPSLQAAARALERSRAKPRRVAAQSPRAAQKKSKPSLKCPCAYPPDRHNRKRHLASPTSARIIERGTRLVVAGAHNAHLSARQKKTRWPSAAPRTTWMLCTGERRVAAVWLCCYGHCARGHCVCGLRAAGIAGIAQHKSTLSCERSNKETCGIDQREGRVVSCARRCCSALAPRRALHTPTTRAHTAPPPPPPPPLFSHRAVWRSC